MPGARGFLVRGRFRVRNVRFGSSGLPAPGCRSAERFHRIPLLPGRGPGGTSAPGKRRRSARVRARAPLWGQWGARAGARVLRGWDRRRAPVPPSGFASGGRWFRFGPPGSAPGIGPWDRAPRLGASSSGGHHPARTIRPSPGGGTRSGASPDRGLGCRGYCRMAGRAHAAKAQVCTGKHYNSLVPLGKLRFGKNFCQFGFGVFIRCG